MNIAPQMHHAHLHQSGIDNRSLVLAWCAYVILVMSIQKFDPLRVCTMAAFPLGIIIALRLPLKTIGKRLLIVSPFILAMAAANPFLDRRAIVLADGLIVRAGIISGSVIVLKALVSVLAVLTMVQSVSMYGICDALRRMRVPEPFTTQLMLLYRYAFLLADEGAALQRARDLRSRPGHGRGIRTTGNLIGTLLLRSTARAERVYNAMCARGFNGTFHAHPHRHFALRDGLWLAAALAAMAAVRFISF